jgi:hypothetical protein
MLVKSRISCYVVEERALRDDPLKMPLSWITLAAPERNRTWTDRCNNRGHYYNYKSLEPTWITEIVGNALKKLPEEHDKRFTPGKFTKSIVVVVEEVLSGRCC